MPENPLNSNQQSLPMKTAVVKAVVIKTENNNPSNDGDTTENANHRSSSKKKAFSRSQHHFSPRDRRRKLNGIRQMRRCENLNFLLSQAELDEDESGEVDFVDLVSHHNSAFQDLFVEPDKMSAWLSFVNSSEEEQDEILAAAKKVNLHDVFKSLEDRSGVTAAECDLEFDMLPDADLARQSGRHCNNFAVTAHQCFQRINRNLRTFLRRNRFPAGELRHLEEELVAFFLEWPTSVYVAELPDSYRRMMLHAVSQYLDLSAHSFDAPGGASGRHTQVENSRRRGDVFVPPPTSLTAYISDNKATLMA